MSTRSTTFVSDTSSTVSPEVLIAITKANARMPPYGSDRITEAAANAIMNECEKQALSLFVPTGTGANLVALASLADIDASIIVPMFSHVAVDEMMVVEGGLGVRVVPIPSPNGKVTVETLNEHVDFSGMLNRPRPGVLSIAQPTEYGTVYSVRELEALSRWCIEHDMRLHIDGSRLANALASLGVPLREMIANVNVSALSLGMTKNGGLFGDCVVLFGPDTPENEERCRRLQARFAQLPAKTWFIGASVLALLDEGLWIRQAEQANAMASRIAEAVRDRFGEKAITQEVETNVVFWKPPADVLQRLREHFVLYRWHAEGEIRTMTSFDTTDAEVSLFIKLMDEA